MGKFEMGRLNVGFAAVAADDLEIHQPSLPARDEGAVSSVRSEG